MNSWVYRGALIAIVIVMAFLYISYMYRAYLRVEDEAGLRVLAGEVPPLVTSRGQGAEVAYLRDLLSAHPGEEALDFRVVTYPFSRHWRHIDTLSEIDMVMTVPVDYALGWRVTRPYVRYQNGVIYRRSAFPDGLGEEPMAALHGSRVVGFAGALQVIEGLSAAEADFSLYLERKSQYRQVFLLASGFADAIIAERTVAEHYFSEVADLFEMGEGDFVFEPVFCATDYVIAVRDGAYRDRLNRAIAEQGETPTVEQLSLTYRPEGALEEQQGFIALATPRIEACIQ